MSLVHRLIRDLKEAGAEVIPLRGDEYVVSMPRSASRVTDIHFIVPEQDLERLVQSLGKDGHDVFPDVPSSEAAYRLLLVHVDEVLAAQPSYSLVRVTAAGIEGDTDRATAEAAPHRPPDSAHLRWTHERPEGS